jgi:hypothetical protein
MTGSSILLGALLVNAACTLALGAALHWAHLPWSAPFVLLPVFFVLITVLLERWQLGAIEKGSQFVQRFMAGMAIKFMLTLMLLLVLLFTTPQVVRLPLALAFAGFYAVHLVYHTVRMYRILRAGGR